MTTVDSIETDPTKITSAHTEPLQEQLHIKLLTEFGVDGTTQPDVVAVGLLLMQDPKCWVGHSEVLYDETWRGLISGIVGSQNDDAIASRFTEICLLLTEKDLLVRRFKKDADSANLTFRDAEYQYNPVLASKRLKALKDAEKAKDVPEADWQDAANCLGVDPDLFFPERGASSHEAKEVCRACDARLACLEYALVNGEKFGIWGGLSERERRRLRRQRAQASRLTA